MSGEPVATVTIAPMSNQHVQLDLFGNRLIHAQHHARLQPKDNLPELCRINAS
jgi:hypothetical protein